MRRDDPALPYAEVGLTDEAAAAHALNRLGYGPRPGEAVAVAAAAVSPTLAARANDAIRAFAASISRESRPNALPPVSPMPCSSALTWRPPTAARRTLTRFSAML